MSIRPVDMQVTLPRTGEVGKINNPDSQRPDVMHQQFAAQLEKEARQETQQVIQSNKSEHGKVDKDGSNKSEREAKKRREKSKKDGKPAPQELEGGMLDIKI